MAMTMGVTAKSVKYCEMLIEADPPKPRRDTGKACMRIGMSTGMRMREKRKAVLPTNPEA